MRMLLAVTAFAILAVTALLFSCNVSAQYVCSPEQLSARYAPGVPLGADGSCPPDYTIATFDNGLTARCASPAVREDDYLDGIYGAFRARNPDGTTKEIQNEHGEKWLLYTRDKEGRPNAFINPDQSVTILTWKGTNLVTRDTDGHLTKYHSWLKGRPNAVETSGVGYVVMGWDQYRIGVTRVESIGTAGVLLGIDYSKAPLRNQTPAQQIERSSMGVAAAPVAPAFFIIDFAATPGLPLIAVGAAAVGGITLGTYIYPIIEPALTRVIDACSQAVVSDQQKCEQAATVKMERGLQACWRDYHAKAYVSPPPSQEQYRDYVEQRQACIKAVSQRYLREIYACMGMEPPK